MADLEGAECLVVVPEEEASMVLEVDHADAVDLVTEMVLVEIEAMVTEATMTETISMTGVMAIDLDEMTRDGMVVKEEDAAEVETEMLARIVIRQLVRITWLKIRMQVEIGCKDMVRTKVGVHGTTMPTSGISTTQPLLQQLPNSKVDGNKLDMAHNKRLEPQLQRKHSNKQQLPMLTTRKLINNKLLLTVNIQTRTTGISMANMPSSIANGLSNGVNTVTTMVLQLAQPE